MVSRVEEIKYDSVELEGITIAYSWCRSRRRTLGITVCKDKSVSVRVPLRTATKEVRAFVISRVGWVLTVWKKLNKRQTPQQQGYVRGAVFMYQGEAYRLEFTKGLRRSLQLHDDLLILTSPEIPSEETIRKMITHWYRAQAVEVVKARSIECHKMMRAEGVLLPPITIRAMKTRWGSYSYATKRIALSLNLIKMPPACLDYVIIHELCHIKVRHHGPDFWQMVSCYCPNYLADRNLLKQYA
ncbi:MAG: SprT family zinc-dependent metalloprotease [Desulfuromonadaceae bacterium]|nr:SprT family zinc-dependent metalloprotease [Desulfuromonadaceae bacterium]